MEKQTVGEYKLLRHPDADCDNCPLNVPSSAYVPSYGPPQAELVIVGEAPGYNETKTGKPFSGQSGQLLNAVLDEYQINRQAAFLTNVVLCRPESNTTPTAKAITSCSRRLKKEIQSRQPRSILALGATAASAIAGTKVKITQYRAGTPKSSDLYPGVVFVPTIHPAACLRRPDQFPYLAADIGKLYGHTPVKPRGPVSWKAYRKPENAVQVLTKLLEDYDDFVIDIETAYDKDTDFVQANHYPVLCLGIGYAPNKVVVIGRPAIDDDSVKFILRRLLTECKISAHNGKFDLSGLAHIAPNAKLHYDTMLTSYVLDERSGTHGLEYLAIELLGEQPYKHMVKG